MQFVDLAQRQMSRGELTKVCAAVGGIEALLDEKCRDQETLILIRHLVAEDQLDKLLENQQVLRLPVVRNGRAATVGYRPEVWKEWK